VVAPILWVATALHLKTEPRNDHDRTPP
jgi:hypothetical protein